MVANRSKRSAQICGPLFREKVTLWSICAVPKLPSASSSARCSYTYSFAKSSGWNFPLDICEISSARYHLDRFLATTVMLSVYRLYSAIWVWFADVLAGEFLTTSPSLDCQLDCASRPDGYRQEQRQFAECCPVPTPLSLLWVQSRQLELHISPCPSYILRQSPRAPKLPSSLPVPSSPLLDSLQRRFGSGMHCIKQTSWMSQTDQVSTTSQCLNLRRRSCWDFQGSQ